MKKTLEQLKKEMDAANDAAAWAALNAAWDTDAAYDTYDAAKAATVAANATEAEAAAVANAAEAAYHEKLKEIEND